MTDIYEQIDASSTHGTYANADKAAARGKQLHTHRGDSADEIDPRRLVRNPTLSELRWYYRRTFAKILVNKPIDDAFKNGYEFMGSDANRATNIMKDLDFDHHYTMAHKKARRDGFALMFIGTRDNSVGIEQSPLDDDVTVKGITHLKVLTIDDLCQCSKASILEQVQESYDLDMDQFEIRQTGIVINTDINSPDFRKPIGYALYQGKLSNGDKRAQFIHRDRVRHISWNQEVDGDYLEDNDRFGVNRWHHERPLGEWEGDSILVASYDLMKGLHKGNWAVMQALFRHASNMYAVYLPRDATDEEFASARKNMTNLNSKSELIIPGGPPKEDEDTYFVEQFSSGDMLEPQEHFDVIFDQICAVHEMTKSVLFGTQTGTVSGSETDIKNYYNKVERFRQGRATKEIHQFLNLVLNMTDGRTNNNAEMNVEIEWGPLFKLSKKDEFDVFFTQAQALTMMINGFMLTPDEARSILSEEWAQIDLESLSESDLDLLDRINLTQVGAWQGAERNEPDEERGNVNRQNGGGMPQGANTGAVAQMGDMSMDAFIDAVADRVVDRLNKDN